MSSDSCESLDHRNPPLTFWSLNTSLDIKAMILKVSIPDNQKLNKETVRKFRWETQSEKEQKTKQNKIKPLCLNIKTSTRTIKKLRSKYVFVSKLRLEIVIAC